jgi:hypothetical protein
MNVEETDHRKVSRHQDLCQHQNTSSPLDFEDYQEIPGLFWNTNVITRAPR